MKRLLRRLTLLLLALASALIISPVLASPAGNLAPLARANGKVIPDQYIVVLKQSGNPHAVAAAANATPHFVYNAALNGFAARLNPGQLNALQHNPNVDYIEPDQEATIDTTQTSATWGLDRIDQRSLPLSGTYTYNHTASNVYAYIIDTGIHTSHPDFGGGAARASDHVARRW